MEEKFLDSLKEAMDIEAHEINMTDNFRDYEEWSSLTYLSVIAMLDEEYDFQSATLSLFSAHSFQCPEPN